MEAPVNVSVNRLEVHLRFEGPDVEDGTMSLEDIVPVLQGFANAFAELAKTDDPDSKHNVKIADVRQGSADVVLGVWTTVSDHPDFVTGAAALLIGSAQLIVRKIIGVVRLKRHVKRRPFKVEISGDRNIVIMNSQKVSIETPKEIYDVFASGRIDKPLNKLTSPLAPGRIEAAEIEALPANGEPFRERITSQERHCFELEDVVVTSSRRAHRIVTLVSVHKGTNNGTLLLTNGKRASYSYKGDNHSKLHRVFGTEDGPVIVQCEEKLDEEKEVVSLDIFDIERLQPDLLNSLTANNNHDD